MVLRLVGPDAAPFVGRPGVVLLVDRDGEADLIGPGGRPLLSGRRATREEPRAEGSGPPPGQDEFREVAFGDARVLALVATLQAAGEPYGRLHLLKSLAPLERSERLTRSLLYGGVSLSFVAVLLLLNLLLSRMVLAPVRRVHDAMARAATGDLRVRLEVHLARRGRQHGRVVQPHGGRAGGEPPAGRGLQPQPREHGRGAHRASCAPPRRACSGSRTTWPR